MLHDTVRELADPPVVYVINTGGQDHRRLRSGYWKAQVATIVAFVDAVAG
jgi:hypothetical protein